MSDEKQIVLRLGGEPDVQREKLELNKVNRIQEKTRSLLRFPIPQTVADFLLISVAVILGAAFATSLYQALAYPVAMGVALAIVVFALGCSFVGMSLIEKRNGAIALYLLFLVLIGMILGRAA